MGLKNIQFNVTMDGLVYTCRAMPCTGKPVTCYVLDIDAADSIYRLDMHLDELTNSYIMHNYSPDIPPEITELEFKISDVLRNRSMS